MGPGPSDVSPRVLQAMAKPTVGHLDPSFVTMMDELKQLLRTAFRTQNAATLPLSAPGSAGMEACFVNLVEPGDSVLVCRNGVFGGRMASIVTRLGATPVLLDHPWGRAVDPDDVRKTLQRHPDITTVAFVHAETSTGAMSDAQAIAQIAREHDCLSIVDTVTSFGGSPLDVDAWGLDAVYSGSQKCLSCAPGLSPVTFSDRAIERRKQRKTPASSWFLDFDLILGYWDGDGGRTYHHTAPVNALYGLHEALLMLNEEGIEAAWARHHHHHLALAAGLATLGLELVVPQNERLPQLNAVSIPTGIDDAATRQALLNRFGLEIGAGLGDLAGKVWRIGLMGTSACEPNVITCLAALESFFTHGSGSGTAVAAALEVYKAS